MQLQMKRGIYSFLQFVNNLSLRKKMAEARSNIGMLTGRRSSGEGDIEAGNGEGPTNDSITKVSSIEEPLDVKVSGGHYDVSIVNIDKWVTSMERILEAVPQYMYNPGHPGRISRIPGNLHEVDAKAYEPYVLSIGPYHHNISRVQEMEKRKRMVLKCVLRAKPELTLKDLLKEIKIVEPAARSFYSDVDMESEKFVQMLLLDGVYIVIVFCGLPQSQERMSAVNNEDINEDTGSEDDAQMTQIIASTNESDDEDRSGERWFRTLFARDLFLLENQLPFFVLQKIYNLVFGVNGTQLMDIMKVNASIMLSGYTKPDTDIVISQTDEIHHLLHLCHMFFRPTLQQESITCELHEPSQMFRLGNAMQLYEAGVRFEASAGTSQHSLLDITFGSSGMMVMPCLHFDDNTISLLRNLIALEQMKYPSLGLHISAYVVMLLHLLTIPEDIKLLRRKGIIQHHLASDKEMVYVINRLSVGLAFDYMEDEFSLKPLFMDLKRYTERRVPRWKVWLKHRYFKNPWTVISLMAATFLLFVTGLQTYYAVYSYHHPYFDGHL